MQGILGKMDQLEQCNWDTLYSTFEILFIQNGINIFKYTPEPGKYFLQSNYFEYFSISIFFEYFKILTFYMADINNFCKSKVQDKLLTQVHIECQNFNK